jgi:DNA-binding PadR family transcriptional regulator
MSQLTPDDVLLGLLAKQPQHGYQLLEAFRDPNQLGEVWHLSTSQLYAVLKRLETQGLIVGHEQTSPDAPTRIEYTLTNVGNRRLYEWLDAEPYASVRRVRVEFLSRLYIARALGLESKPLIDRQRNACERLCDEIRAEMHTRTEIGQMSLRLFLAQVEVILKWLDEIGDQDV